MSELNPNHVVTQEVRDQWYKLCAVLMLKFGVTEIELTTEDIHRFSASGLAAIAVAPKGDVMALRLIGEAEAQRLARQEGGLPV